MNKFITQTTDLDADAKEFQMTYANELDYNTAEFNENGQVMVARNIDGDKELNEELVNKI